MLIILISDLPNVASGISNGINYNLEPVIINQDFVCRSSILLYHRTFLMLFS